MGLLDGKSKKVKETKPPKTKWTEGKCTIVKKPIRQGVDVYHIYREEIYVAQRTNLEAAKEAAKKFGK